MIVLVIQKKNTFANLMEFVEREEDSQSSDFAFQLLQWLMKNQSVVQNAVVVPVVK